MAEIPKLDTTALEESVKEVPKEEAKPVPKEESNLKIEDSDEDDDDFFDDFFDN